VGNDEQDHRQYRVIGPCKVAGVAPGDTVTRRQVMAFGGPGSHIHFDVLVGTHLEEVADGPPAGKAGKPDTSKGPK
jgi:hypothetical protein